MECTQRLECTQECYEINRTDKQIAEQIGFLGICGVKHPVKKGPNKIGRDPQTCSIVLNLNSVSRQHAVINILNQREFMLMDLDSANKTKLMDKVLQPYVPQPLKDGDMVQFGDIFGVFRLLEENDDLPMTQAIDIPETPISARHMSKLNKAPSTTVPESPDVSDRDDSFIAPSQVKAGHCFKKSNSHFIKPSSNIISVQPIGSKNIDNVYWSSGKHSLSLNSSLDESNDKLNISNKHFDSSIHEVQMQNPFSVVQTVDQSKNIHEMETQMPYVNDRSPKQYRNNIDEGNKYDNIHEMETQMPYVNDRSLKQNSYNTKKENGYENIHEMETQIPYLIDRSPKQNRILGNEENKYDNIHEMQTQIPFVNDNVTSNGNNIHELATQILPSNDVNDSVDSIYTAQTQIPHSPTFRNLASQSAIGKEQLPEICKIDNQHEMKFDLYTANKVNDDDIFKADTQPFVEQNEIAKHQTGVLNSSKDSKNEKLDISKSDDDIIIEEMDAEYCEEDFQSQPLFPLDDILENNDTNKLLSKDTQLLAKTEKLNKNKTIASENHSDSSTDCEDITTAPTQKIFINQDDDLTDCEDTLEDIPKNVAGRKSEVTCGPNDNFEDLLTQKIYDNIEDLPTQIVTAVDEGNKEQDIPNNDTCFEDMPTQIIAEDNISNDSITNKNNFESPFKIPLISPIKVKRKEIKSPLVKDNVTPKKILPDHKGDDDDDSNYYAATQDILEDLCSQQGKSPQASSLMKANNDDKIRVESDDELVPCSVEEYKAGNKFPHLENDFKSYKSTDSTDDEEISFVPNLTSQQIREVIGVSPQVDKLRKEPSDPSDVEVTPKKVRSFKFIDVELPDSQEIKTTVSLHQKTPVTESSSESETENDSQECTPILFRKKRNPKKDAKIDLTKKFDVASLPSRIITRVRKPTAKLQNNNAESAKSTNILKPKFITEQEDEIDKDIIHENISRLKNKSEKCKRKDSQNKKSTNVKDSKKQKENQKQLLNNDIDHKIEYCDTIKESKGVVKIDTIINERTENEFLAIRFKSDSSLKSEPKLKSDSDTSVLKTKFCDKGINDDISKDTSTETNVSLRSKRSTRNREKADTVKEMSQVDENEDSKKTRRNKSTRQKQPSKKPVEIDLTEETVTEVRRSKRQRSSKEKKEEKLIEQKKTVPKSILKKYKPVKHEQSTVYSLSSGSSTDSPLSLKRPAMSDVDPPSPKRTRSNVSLNDMNLRSTPARFNKKQHVLFTAFPSEEVRVKLEKLGADIVSDVSTCTVVLTLQIKRTFKLLCAVGLGKPIVGPNWVQACADSNMIVDPWLYVLKDEAAEKRFQFNLERVLMSKRNFLKGYNVSSTPKVLPNATEMKLIVECSGGTWKEGGPQWICVSSVADKALWPSLKKKGATVVSAEFILGGVLRQRVDIQSNKL